MSPSSLLLFLIATASAALAHLLWGRRWLQLPAPGGVPVLEVVLGAWILLIIASRLRV
jgi:hypothetical protein